MAREQNIGHVFSFRQCQMTFGESLYVVDGHTLTGPEYASHRAVESAKGALVLKAVREDPRVLKNPHELVGHEEVAQCLRAMWPSRQERCVKIIFTFLHTTVDVFVAVLLYV